MPREKMKQNVISWKLYARGKCHNVAYSVATENPMNMLRLTAHTSIGNRHRLSSTLCRFLLISKVEQMKHQLFE